MATIILGGLGAGIGSVFGATHLGFSVGVAVGGVVDQFLQKPPQTSARLSDLKITGSQYGVIIPIVWGSYRLPTNLIDYTTDVNGNFIIENRHKHSAFFGLEKLPSTYTYTASFACLVCAGPVTRVKRIWAGDRLIYNDDATPKSVYNIRIYLGDETQTADSALVAQHGAAATPAYRGSCYFMVQDLPLKDFGNAVPNPLSAVVERFTAYHDLIDGTNGLQTYYRFDTSPGQLVDSGPLAHNLSAVGSPTTISGHANEGVSCLTGSSFRAIIGNEPIYQPARFSVEAWFQWGETSEIYGAGAVTYQNPNTAEFPWKLRVSPEAVSLEHLDLQFSINTNANPNVTVFHWNVPFDALWHHWVVTYDTTGNAILYFDGVAQVTTAAPVSAIGIASDPTSQVNITSGSNGQLHWDEVAFYNRALTPAEVLLHYQGAATTLGTVMAEVFAAEGLTANEWDVSAATDAIDGFALTDRRTARDLLDAPLAVYQTLLPEYDGKLIAVKRGAAAVATIPAADLGAALWSGSSQPTAPVETKRLQELELPFRIDISFLSLIREFQASTQGAERYTKVSLQDPVTINTALLLTDTAARQAAQRQLYQIWTEREQFTFSLPMSYLYLAPGDVVNLPVLGQTVRARITQMDAALPGPIQCTAVLDDVGILTQTAAGAAVASATISGTDAISTQLVIWNGNALVDADADTLGLYFAANGATAGFWPGAEIYWSTDSGASYQSLVAVTDAATVGTAQSVLAPGPGTRLWDTISTVDVLIVNGDAPVTTSDADVIAGANVALVGREYIQFATATSLGSGVYRLSRLIRGQRGSDIHWNDHASGESFALLDFGLNGRVTFDNSLRSRAILVKAVTPGQDLPSVSPVSVFIGGDEARTYSPDHLTASRNGSFDLALTWFRRAREDFELRDGSDIPLDEAVESYDCCILDGFPQAFTAVALGSSTVLTVPAHGYSVGAVILLKGLGGCVYLNHLSGTITATTTNTLTVALNSAGMPAWTSGGTTERIVRVINVSTPTATYLASQQVTDGFIPASDTYHVAILQLGTYGRGWPLVATGV